MQFDEAAERLASTHRFFDKNVHDAVGDSLLSNVFEPAEAQVRSVQILEVFFMRNRARIFDLIKQAKKLGE